MKILLGAAVWVLSWLASIYFYRRLRDTHQGFLEAILCMVLMGVSAWVMGFTFGIWFSVVMVILTTLTWWISKKKLP